MSDPVTPSTARQPRPSTAQRVALPKDLLDFLIELSIALHKHAMYPGGHPTLEPASAAVAQRLETLLLERGTLSLGVAREQLVIEGVASDPRNPVLHDLADRLHRHHLGAVTFARGVTWEELEDALKLLAVDADRDEGPIGLRPATRLATWPHLRLFPITFDRLELIGDEGTDEGGEVSGGGRPAQLWIGLARAALAAEGVEQKKEEKPREPHAFRPEPVKPLSDAELDAAVGQVTAAGDLLEGPAEPQKLAAAIESHERGTAYDQVIVGYLLQIAEELKTAGGAGAVALKKKMSKLISALAPGTLERLIDMGGDLAQRRQFLLDASQGMAVDAVVDLVEAASRGGAPISGAMIRMLTKLGHHAERGPAPRRNLAETGLREQVAELIQGWTLADPNPGGYGQALQRMVAAAPTFVSATEQQYAPEPLRIVQMAIESGAEGDVLRRAVEEVLAAGRMAELIQALERAPQGNPAAALIRQRAVNADTLGLLLSTAPVDFDLVDRVVGALGAVAAGPPMLHVLAESESRQVRRALIDRLAAMGDAIGPLLVPRLADPRWYVVRNMLYIAAEMPRVPAGLDAGPFRQHADPRVRREAMRVLFRHPVERSRAICTALTDEDPRTRRLALSSVGAEGWPEPAVPLLAALATNEEADEDLRVSAVRALGAQGGRLALDALLRIAVVRRRTIIGAMMQQGASPVVLAAVTALGGFGDARARQRLEALAAGRDPAAARAAADALKGAK